MTDGLVHHGDRGVIRYTERLAEAGIKPSVGSVGDSYNLFKTELIHRQGTWRNAEAVELATLEMTPARADRKYPARTNGPTVQMLRKQCLTP